MIDPKKRRGRKRFKFGGLLAQQDATASPPLALDRGSNGSLLGMMDALGQATLGGLLTGVTSAPGSEAERALLGTGADFTPVVGDYKAAVHDAPRLFGEGHPIMGGIAAASALPLLGLPFDAMRTVMKKVDDLPDTGGLLGREGITAYHGSPHDFDKFSLDAIGTGEGAQAYGHGLYFAESEDVARSYREGFQRNLDNNFTRPTYDIEQSVVSPGKYEISTVSRSNAGYQTGGVDFDNTFDSVEDAERWLRDNGMVGDDYTSSLISDDIPEFGVSLSPRARMYQVRINADPEDFLDWDKPLGEQPERVREALRHIDPERFTSIERSAQYNPSWPDNHSGATFYTGVAGKVDGPRQAELSSRLADLGIPGIRYLDGNSRGVGEGTSNYVLFDDSLVEILKKYGLAGLLGTGVARQQQERRGLLSG